MGARLLRAATATVEARLLLTTGAPPGAPPPRRPRAHIVDRLRTGRWRVVFAAVWPLAVPAMIARAQELPANDTTLARLTSEAIAANPTLLREEAVARAVAARVRPAGALPDPMLMAGVMDLTLPRFAFRESDFTEVDVEVSQEFPWPGTLGARTAGARAQARASRADVATRRRELVARTAEVYYRLRYVVTALATLTRQRERLATGVDIATARYAATSAPQSDPLQARVALARLDTEEADLVAEGTKLRARLKALRNVIGRDSLAVEPIRPELISDSLHRTAASGAIPARYPPALDSVPEHPRLVARRAAVEAAEQTVRAEQLGARPDVTIMTRYGARPLGPDFFSAFIGLRLPLYAGRKQHRLTDAARAEADAARAALADEQAALAEDIQTTLAQIQSGAVRLRLLTNQVVAAAQATVDATLRNYRVGQVEFLTVLAAEDALYRARLDAARVAAECLTHLVMFGQLVTPEDNP